MPDAPAENRVPADLAAVNLHESWEITYWCAHFRCTEAQLRAAMKECGSIITDEIAACLRRDAPAPGGG
jgi:hypothetical protein